MIKAKNTLNSAILILCVLMCIGFIQAQEICDNRIDDDGDGLIDCLDPDCSYSESACWQCETEFYQVHSNTTLVSLDPALGTYTRLGTISGAQQINGVQFNHIDGHVYAPCVIDGVHTLGMLSQDGSVRDLGLTLPGSGIFYVGAVDANGVMYIANGSGIHSVDLNAPTLSVVNTGAPFPGVADFSLDITRGLIYGITGKAKLKVFDPAAKSIQTYDLAGTINADSGGYGAAWSCVDGSFFAYNNSSGKIYSIDVNNLVATEVLNATGNLSINDGFNCVLAPPPFESNCSNGKDDDGDGLVDCDDPDCYSSNNCTVEICDNGIDDDNDGWVDCSDSECYSLNICVEICDNGIDDNNNGLVDGNDPQCGTSSGITGGLESNRRLSEKISKRNYKLTIEQPVDYTEKLEGLIPFTKSSFKSGFGISTFIPTEIEDAYIAESSPSDLIAITNAKEVAAADYYKNDQRVASVLGIYSEDGVYEHTKYICDRLDGSRLLDISYLYAMGGNFINYELINKAGQKEYAVSFSAWIDQEGKFTIENHWNLHKYTEKKDYYNFQIWANSNTQLIELLENILTKIESVGGIDNIVHSAIPRVFVMEGKYVNGTLKLTIKNKNKTPKLSIHGSYTQSENGELKDLSVDVALSGAREEVVTVETGYLYDLGASLSVVGNPDDEIFLADGAWGIDNTSTNADVQTFEVHAQEEVGMEDVYQVERSILTEANVKTYLNIYRPLDVKYNPKNLSQFNSLAFAAEGEGTVEVTLVKASISDWENQFRTKIVLPKDKRDMILFFDEFESATHAHLMADDITMIVFSILGDQVTYVPKTMGLEHVRFQAMIISSTDNLNANGANAHVYPNPVGKVATLKFENKENGNGFIQVLNELGRVVHQMQVVLYQGHNEFQFDMSQMPEGVYFYDVSNNHYLLSRGKFIKIKE